MLFYWHNRKLSVKEKVKNSCGELYVGKAVRVPISASTPLTDVSATRNNSWALDAIKRACKRDQLPLLESALFSNTKHYRLVSMEGNEEHFLPLNP